MSKPVPVEMQAKVKSVYKALLDMTGGSKRLGQSQMIAEIAKAVANAKFKGEVGTGARLAAVSAPTGSGKSFGYGVGVIPMALAMDLKVVISVSTVSLQEQLFDRDLKVLAKVIPEMKCALIKGRSRFFCVVKAEKSKEGGGEVGVVADDLLNKLKSNEWDGDVDALRNRPKDEVWANFTNDRNGCQGKKCSSYSACPFYRSRAAAETANVTVVNHDLLLADVAAGNFILPKLSEAIVVVDEAHHLPGKALGSLASSHALGDAIQWLQRASGIVASIRRMDPRGNCGRKAAEVARSLEIMGGVLKEAKFAIADLGKTTNLRDPGRPVRFPAGKLPQWLGRVAKDCMTTSESARLALVSLMDSLNGEDGEGLMDKKREAAVADVGNAMSRIDRIVAVWRLMSADLIDAAPVAKWVEIEAESGDLKVSASPVGVGQYLHDCLWSQVAASIHLSATMTTVGGFAPYLKASGLSHTEGVRTLEVETPFDYQRQAQIVVPRGFASAKDSKAHTQALTEYIPGAVQTIGDGEGCLCLFSSWSQLREVANGMPDWLKAMLLTQEQMSKRDVLAAHLEAIKAGRKSVIFGTASFEEGVDLKGNACTLVVVAKIPFGVPSDPVSETLQEHLTAQGRCHFSEIVLPEACKRLAQAAGRLIRCETDRGSIVVADTRLVETRYGRAMLATLPAYRIAYELPRAA